MPNCRSCGAEIKFIKLKSRIVDILMHDVEDEIETVLYDDCEEVEE